MYESDLEISEDWRFERPVGSGSFGVAALFKRYQFDEIIDDVVVKDAFQRDIDPVSKKRPSLSREAAVMAQTNELNDASLLRLRNYKYLEDAKQYRYFFQNRQYGDLEVLRLKHKAWQIHVPELFLWHLFSCFEKGHGAMTKGAFRSMRPKDFGVPLEDGYLIHCDIKTDNSKPPQRTFCADAKFFSSLSSAVD